MNLKKIFSFIIFFASATAIFPLRVISMAPAITEIVFALGKGDALVGVTNFCDYPAAAKKIAKIGGLLDINMEALLALDPEIVIAYPEQSVKVKFLESRVLVLVVKHQTLSDLFDSILKIGGVLDAETAAQEMVSSLQNKLAAIAARAGNKKKVRTLIIAGRQADDLKNMFIVGKNDFLNELLGIAGGVNAYRGEINYPNISMESVISLDPDFILEISAFYEGISDEKVFALWRPYWMLQAVRRQRIKIIKKSFWLRPGSRVGYIAEEMAEILAAAEKTNESGDKD
jgi:iron complex transport system substrate-binding protein